MSMKSLMHTLHCATKISVGHTILNQWYPTNIYGKKIGVCHYTELVMSYKLVHWGLRNSESA